MTKTCDTSKVTIREIPKSTAKRMIKKFHYTHSFSSCRFALGIFYQKDTQHRFFDTEDEELIDDDYPRAEEIDDDEYAPDN